MAIKAIKDYNDNIQKMLMVILVISDKIDNFQITIIVAKETSNKWLSMTIKLKMSSAG